MGYDYAQKRRGTAAPGNESGRGVAERSFPNSARLDALKSGAMRPTAADKGHRLELREAMRAKMEQSFGADLSNVKLYESQTVSDAGAEAVTQGNEIAFAPGKTDFSSASGQALLGHELSHVVSQSRGEVTGGGFLSDSGLEARADREGAMAARGETIYSGEMNGGAFAPLSSASAAPMAGPMQAKKKQKKVEKQKNSRAQENRGDLESLLKSDLGVDSSKEEKNKYIKRAEKDFQKKLDGNTEHIEEGDAVNTLYGAHEENLNTNFEDTLTDRQKYYHENKDMYEDMVDYRDDCDSSGIKMMSPSELADYRKKIKRQENLQEMMGAMKSMKSGLVRNEVLKEEIKKDQNFEQRSADPETLNKDFKLPEMSDEERKKYENDYWKKQKLENKEHDRIAKENKVKRGEEFDAQRDAIFAAMEKLKDSDDEW